MEKRFLVGLLAATLVVTGSTFGESVQAAETESKFYIDGAVTDEEGNYELCIGDYTAVEVGAYSALDDTDVDVERCEFVSEYVLSEVLKQIVGNEDLCYYSSDKQQMGDDWTSFDGAIPEAAFGKYVYKFTALAVEDEPETEYASDFLRSESTVHSWGGTNNMTFASNQDGKTVTVYSIYKNNTSAASIPEEITVGGTTYKVTGIINNALENYDIKSVKIPESVTKIGEEAFYQANKLKSITIQGGLQSVGKKAFAGINRNAVIKIEGSKAEFDHAVKMIRNAGAPKTVSFKHVK